MSSVSADLNNADQEVALVTSGYSLKKERMPQGMLEQVQGLHEFIARNVRRGYVKMRWSKPLNITTHTNVKGYLMYRGAVNDFATASFVTCVTKNTFTQAPGIGTWYYWVVAVNNMGNGLWAIL